MADSKNLNDFLCSWAGMDGGNLCAPIWICGIEPGGELENADALQIPRGDPPCWDAKFKEAHPKFATWQYHQKVAKLLIVIERILASPPQQATVDGYKDYMRDKLYTCAGQSFKLNLFPLASPSVKCTKWPESFRGAPLLADKGEYYKRCRAMRFPFLAKLRHEHRPKVIVATGRMHCLAFAEAFGFALDSEQEPIPLPHNRQCRVFLDQGSALIVSPFFGGRYGMNSDGLLIELARKVAGMLRQS